MKYDCIILGDGPAGITAAIYLKRANCNPLVISKGESNLLKAEHVDNYYGFPEGISGKSLYENGLKQAKELSISIINDEVLNIEYDGKYKLECVNDSFTSDVLILATGSKKKNPRIINLDKLSGKGISYCAICDGFFYRKKKIGVVGSGIYALHEYNILKNITDDITLFTNGERIEFNSDSIHIMSKKIDKVIGEEFLEEIEFFDGTTEKLDGLFIASGSASTNDLALKLGVIIENNNITINDKMETNMPGLYACGDATGGVLQISKAVYEGTIAGLEASKYIKKKK